MSPRRRTVGGDPSLDLFGYSDAVQPPTFDESRAGGASAIRGADDEAPSRASRRRRPTRDEGGSVARVQEPLATTSSLEEQIPGATPASAVSVATLTQTAKDVMEGAFVPLWVRGEVGDFKAHRNGHWYFSLRDGEAQVRCVVWSRDRRRIPAPPDDGMEIAALGQVTVYPSRGELQFSVPAMEARGDGLWRKALEMTLALLQGEGLLDLERKRPLPRFPRRVAVVTSPDGAAIHDIVAVARRRYAAVEIVVVPAKVQGDGAPEELCAAIGRVARWGAADVVIIGRGGGAREDLWAFNDVRVARAIATCPVPTVSAVGHEIDLTIADLVADVRASTPSAAAEAAVPLRADLESHLRALGVALQSSMKRLLSERRDALAMVARDARDAACLVVSRERGRLEQTAARLDTLSPLATLGRGYAVARGADGEMLASSRDFSPGMAFSLLLRDGTVRATTESVERGSRRGPPRATRTLHPGPDSQ